MALETATYINGLVATNPTGSDPVAQADDHLRLLKSVLKTTFPNISGAVTASHTDLSNVLPKTGGTMTGTLTLNTSSPVNALDAASKGYVDTKVAAATSGLSDPGANGMLARTTTGTTAARTLTAGTGISITNGNGVSGNPTITNTGVTSVNGSAGAVTISTTPADGSITPAKLSGGQTGSAPAFAARAWVNFDGTRDTSGAASTTNTDRFIRGSGNIASVTRTAAGEYTINFITAMPNASYAVSFVCDDNQTSSAGPSTVNIVSQSTTSCSIEVGQASNNNQNDTAIITGMIIG